MTVFDSAEIYGFGRSERILGAALGDDRPKVVVASKILPVLPVAAVVQQRAVASAARLGVTSIDLYQVHQPNPLVADHTTMRGMRTLQDVGLVGEVGVSNYGLRRWQVAEAALGRRVLSNQVRYSMLDRAPEQDLLPYARQAGRVVIAYSPLAQGFLSGRYDAGNPPTGAVRRANPYFLPENLERGAVLIDTLREVADAHDATPSQIALAYAAAPPERGGHPRRVRGGADGTQRRRRRHRPRRRRVHGAGRGRERFRPITGLAAMPAMLRARIGPTESEHSGRHHRADPGRPRRLPARLRPARRRPRRGGVAGHLGRRSPCTWTSTPRPRRRSSTRTWSSTATTARTRPTDAIGDHNKIRDAHRRGETAPGRLGRSGGRRSARPAPENSEHLAEEEDEALPDFRRHAGTELRAELGQRWLTFYGEHKNGRDLPFRDKDPQQYVADHR